MTVPEQHVPLHRQEQLPLDRQTVIQDVPGPVVILGAGNIGRWMAQEALLAGQSVRLVDSHSDALVSAERTLKDRIGDLLQNAEQAAGALSRVSFAHVDISSPNLPSEIFSDARYVIEALPEREGLKRAALCTLDSLVPPRVPIITMSSSYPIEELLDETSHPDRFINGHPLQRGISAVEIMGSSVTSSEVQQETSGFFESIGMVPITVQKENVGFIFNIAWRGIKKTALSLVEKGICSPEDFDRLWMMAFKTPYGPFGAMDLVGLDTVLDIEKRYAMLSGQASDTPPAFLQQMVNDGALGVKSLKGFYTYPCPSYTRPGFLECGPERADQEAITPIRDTLIGTWKLVSYTATVLGSEKIMYPLGEEAGGQLIYGRDGGMSASLHSAYRERCESDDPLKATPLEAAAAFSTYLSYYGQFRYLHGVVFHDVQACSFPNWSGATLIRTAALDRDGYLTLSTPPIAVGGSVSVQRLKWRRA